MKIVSIRLMRQYQHIRSGADCRHLIVLIRNAELAQLVERQLCADSELRKVLAGSRQRTFGPCAANIPALSRFAESSPASFIHGIRAAREKIVARSDEDRQDFLRKRGFSKAETGRIVEAVLTEEDRTGYLCRVI